MLASRRYTRRSLFRLGASLLLSSRIDRLFAFRRSALPVQFSPHPEAGTSSWLYRDYAVHATVMLGGIPLLSKKNVGGAAVALERAAEGDSAWTALQFVAGSWPERLKGFNRFGATQELVRDEKGTPSESGYVSFMATSRETGLTEARKAFSSQSTSQMFTFARGKATERGCAFTLERRSLGAKCTWLDCVDLLTDATSPEELPPEQHVAGYGSHCLPTFLFAVHRALGQLGSGGESSYAHNGKIYRLRTEWKAEESSGTRVMTGRTWSEGEHGADFRIWLEGEGQTGLPVKIEYRPRSFLKLTIERSEALRAQTLHPLLKGRDS